MILNKKKTFLNKIKQSALKRFTDVEISIGKTDFYFHILLYHNKKHKNKDFKVFINEIKQYINQKEYYISYNSYDVYNIKKGHNIYIKSLKFKELTQVPNKLYHYTSITNRQSILLNGLVPKKFNKQKYKGEHFLYYKPSVFFYYNKEASNSFT